MKKLLPLMLASLALGACASNGISTGNDTHPTADAPTQIYTCRHDGKVISNDVRVTVQPNGNLRIRKSAGSLESPDLVRNGNEYVTANQSARWRPVDSGSAILTIKQGNGQDFTQQCNVNR